MLRELDLKGFIFHKIEVLFNPNDLEESSSILKEYIENMVNVEGETLYYDIDVLKEGEEIKPHFHLIPGSFQAVVWIPSSDFKGRSFLFGNPSKLNKVKPELGYMCFMKPNDPNFIHGVSPYLRGDDFKTIGFSSLVKPFEENKSYDYFVEVEVDKDFLKLSNLI